MSDFSRPEYASYIELCRQLHLDADEYDFWLPSLSDWLEMLEVAGFTVVNVNCQAGGWGEHAGLIGVHATCHRDYAQQCNDFAGLDSGECWKQHAFALTREEAVARLWLAVRGQQP